MVARLGSEVVGGQSEVGGRRGGSRVVGRGPCWETWWVDEVCVKGYKGQPLCAAAMHRGDHTSSDL